MERPINNQGPGKRGIGKAAVMFEIKHPSADREKKIVINETRKTPMTVALAAEAGTAKTRPQSRKCVLARAHRPSQTAVKGN